MNDTQESYWGSGLLAGKRALITGASGTLGSGLARAMAASGADIIAHYQSGQGAAESLCAGLNREGFSALPLQADLAREEDVRRLFGEIRSRFGTIDILVNNAGVFTLSRQENLETEDWNAVFDLNTKGLFFCCREAVPLFRLKAIPGGSIINIASINALHPGFGSTAHYDASKGAVVSYTRSLAVELGREGVRVNAIAPGLIESDSLEEQAEELVAMYREKAPLGRLITPEDVAAAAVFLASEAARAITGHVLTVDNGYLLA